MHSRGYCVVQREVGPFALAFLFVSLATRIGFAQPAVQSRALTDSALPAPSVVVSTGIVFVDTVYKNDQPWVGGVAKLGVTILGRTRVGAIILGAGQPDSDGESRLALGFLVSQSFYLTRRMDITGFVGIGRETYTYPNMNYTYSDTSTHGLWIYPGLSLDFMYRYKSFQIGGGPFLAIPYHGIQSGPEIDNVKDDRYARSGFGGSFGGQVFVGI